MSAPELLGETVSLEHHIEVVAMVRRLERYLAFEEARQAILTMSREAVARGRTPEQQIDFIACAHVVAALRGEK